MLSNAYTFVKQVLLLALSYVWGAQRLAGVTNLPQITQHRSVRHNIEARSAWSSRSFGVLIMQLFPPLGVPPTHPFFTPLLYHHIHTHASASRYLQWKSISFPLHLFICSYPQVPKNMNHDMTAFRRRHDKYSNENYESQRNSQIELIESVVL